ncbi:flagellar hook-associated protein 3 [Pseudomonas putida CSV86]|uniref:Flagellar hook-associated protein 3 n=1 Tax=Pseudomonas bharatica CSV86 TaxID=1005395 RepID=L1LXB9_9PSED|nr:MULTISPECIES: flagellar hook-associated protein 3 [Pseudomonas]MDG9882687.1 flagellar hook-associated protein 3 [Pseudomonas sp. GD04058]NNJ16666.1 flagellar hook-associated protein 3 [Pseudomonas bharatica CSV86]
MRISTSQYYESSAANYQRNYSNVVKTGEEASDLIRVRTAADDPVGAARLLQLDHQNSMLEQYATNTTSVRNSLSQAETTLNSINTLLQRVNELALGAGNAGFTDTERKATATELGKLEEQLLSLMNTRDENGQYLFSGSKSDTQPFVRNADGTYSYMGDEGELKLQVGDMLTMAATNSGAKTFQQALNTNRTQTTLTAPTPDDGRVRFTDGQMSSASGYNDQFRSGQPYTITLLSSTQFKVTDASGTDVTADATNAGTFDPSTTGGVSISFRGVDLRLNINLQTGDTNPDAVVAGHTFTLESKPDTITGVRSPGNASSAQVSSTQVVDADKYAKAFPSGGAVIKFTSATDFELYASPVTADSRPVANGTLAGTPPTATAAGVQFDFSAAPASGDQYVVQVNKHQTQNILDTVAQLRQALEQPIDGSTAGQQQLREALDAAISNISSGQDQLGYTVTSIGGRGKALDLQELANESLSIANASTQSSIRDSDPAEVMTRLTLQQTMLQASQMAFSRISQLSLFNSL